MVHHNNHEHSSNMEHIDHIVDLAIQVGTYILQVRQCTFPRKLELKKRICTLTALHVPDGILPYRQFGYKTSLHSQHNRNSQMPD